MGGGAARRLDLLPISIDLTPECCSPGEVEFIQCAVIFLQPCPKCSGGVVAETLANVTAILVVHVPHGQGSMVLVTFSQLCSNARGVMVIIGVMRTVVAA